MLRISVKEVRCPRCGAEEVSNPDAPLMEQRLNIRAFKVHDGKAWRSQCLLCKEAGRPDWF
jgi:hypothetical protein